MNKETCSESRPTMLTIRETARTGILPEWTLRTLVREGRCPHIKVGNRALIPYERLCEMLEGREGRE